MTTRIFSVLGLAAMLIAGVGSAQETPKAPPPSFEVHPDRTVTFRWLAPNAKEVFLQREGTKKTPMQKDDSGYWSLTTEPLDPDLYGYSFEVDGATALDPKQPLLKPNLLNSQNMIRIPDPSLPWEVSNVPHGEVHHHYYHSGVVGDDRDYFVYTPPGYDPKASRKYPVLYLLHGYSDDASGWTAVGRANIILDNLIAQGKTKPMLVVMTLGYGAPEIVAGFARVRSREVSEKNLTRYRDSLLTEVIPAIEKQYRANTDRDNRAIAGLSMGGAETLFTGLNNTDKFSWIGSFSAGGIPGEFDQAFPSLNGAAANSKLHVLWIACGTDDGLITANRKFRDWLTSKEVRFTPAETPGAHTWMVWRRNLASFTPLLFR